MMSRTIAALAALWLVLIIVPALVAARLLPVAGDTAHKGWAVGIWVAGYVAQFLVFRAMARRSPRPVGLGWLVASTVPWAADWTAPLSRWAVAVCAAIVIGVLRPGWSPRCTGWTGCAGRAFAARRWSSR